MRGFFGIGVYHPKTEENIGTLWRSAYAFGASCIFTVGRRYKHQVSDTVNAPLSIPLYEFLTLEEFEYNMPWNCQMVCVEITKDAVSLPKFTHYDRTFYLLGAEDYGIPEKFMKDKHVVQIPTRVCLNVSVAGSIIMYDRISKGSYGA